MSLNVGGIVLCGGESRRMGRPKAWLQFGNELMLQRVVRIISAAVSRVVVVAAPDQEVPSLPSSISVVRDHKKGRGPLEGLAAGLARLRELDYDAAYASSTDVPFINARFIKSVIELLGDESIAVPYVAGRYHPLAAVYRTSALPAIEQLLAHDQLRPTFLFDMLPTRRIEAHELVAADLELKSLDNLNTPADYQAALRAAGLTQPNL